MPEAEWNDEHTRIVCELFEEQVRAGNRPNTHLNNIGYRQVAAKFQQRTELLYTKLQLKNKWDKFKNDYITWRKLLVVGKGLPWDTAKGTFVADEEWWKKINKELPGARKFRHGGLHHEDKLNVMFDYITSNGVDPSPPAPESPKNGVNHSPPAATGLPSAPDCALNGVDHSPVTAHGLPSGPYSPMNGMDQLPLPAHDLRSVQEIPMNGVNLDGLDNNTEDNDDIYQEPVFQYTSNRKKRPISFSATKKNKKNKAETALLMQAHLYRITELAQKAQDTFKKFSSQADLVPWPSIQDVMTLVWECGARCGSNEHFIATELFVSREQREMFLTMETAEERFQWLRRKYIVKYLSGTTGTNLGTR
ncbi:uncharacterized protein [Zea mays]|uniref:Myb/SANT-like domain-containing protein n=1 Tax=Zea mays TaxID=4577 RepID=B4FZA6_MAIZE|nr:uncharacterized protein LOC100274146 [Zea mays]XP_008672515.1 uncharacterized protein LOC100274146 isoform X1 [Zea mays]ACF87449.1 unknown [Zea mays]|eukprot:NP_001141996.1 uncharacterized protein LOC100274146 [Zea mays]